MSLYKITDFKGNTMQDALLVYYCVVLPTYDKRVMSVWMRRFDNMFRIEIERMPYTMKEEDKEALIEGLFQHLLTKSKYRVQAIAEGWKEQGYIIEHMDYNWGWDE
jgi:hypothetical protein